tara:strand:+ start:157 stop:405 length:249 start_codon:yes stop_codon:yes gene_type:complete
MKDNFNHRKWFKNQYLEESAESDLNEISREAYYRMGGLANETHLNELKDLIRILGEEWVNEGFEKEDIADYLYNLSFQVVRS